MTKPSKITYEWGRRSYPVNPEVVGNAIERIERKMGHCPPGELVKVAEPEDHPMHGQFTWDNNAAADKWRTQEARNLINSLVVTCVVNDQEVKAPAFLSVGHTIKTQDAGEGYRSLNVVMAHAAFADEATAEVMAKLRAIRQRYAALEALAPVWAAFDEIAA